jgi:hypothetical protein
MALAPWIPAFAGMTVNPLIFRPSFVVRLLDNNRSFGLITIADAFETCYLGHRTGAATNQGVEAAAGSASASRLCRFSHDAGISADGSPVRRAWACRPVRRTDDGACSFQGVSWSSGQNHRWRRSTKC